MLNKETEDNGHVSEIKKPLAKQREYPHPLNQARRRIMEAPQQAPDNDRLRQLRTMPYEEYLKTPEWRARRQKALRFAGFRCQVCNSPDRLEVHHRTYERRGHELLGDLTTLCNDCHMIFHNHRPA